VEGVEQRDGVTVPEGFVSTVAMRGTQVSGIVVEAVLVHGGWASVCIGPCRICKAEVLPSAGVRVSVGSATCSAMLLTPRSGTRPRARVTPASL